MRVIKKKYHYFYKITNNINGHFYYGIHSTNDLDDGYMGSGTRLRYAYEKYGIESFTKEILKFFETRELAAKYESDVVNEHLIKDENCYNIVLGGDVFTTLGLAVVKNTDGHTLVVPTDDSRISLGELVGINTDTAAVKDSDGNTYRVSVNDSRLLSGEFVGCTKGKVTVKDKNNNCFLVDVNHPKIISGELKPIWCGKKHKPETIEKVKIKYKEIGHQQGEKNSQYGTCWITKDNTNKKIKKEDLDFFEQQGWRKGRKLK